MSWITLACIPGLLIWCVIGYWLMPKVALTEFKQYGHPRPGDGLADTSRRELAYANTSRVVNVATLGSPLVALPWTRVGYVLIKRTDDGWVAKHLTENLSFTDLDDYPIHVRVTYRGGLKPHTHAEIQYQRLDATDFKFTFT